MSTVPAVVPTTAQPVVDAILRVEPLAFPWQTPDPFLFCVHHDDAYPAANEHFGPAASLAGRDMGQDFAGKDGWRMYHGQVVPGFPQHPHRGFETVTVARRGLIDHADSMGAAARYGQGDVQWLTAGRGIQHAEMFPLLDRNAPNPVELFQIWLNLPARDKMVEPYFKMLWADTVPHVFVKDHKGLATEIALVAGQLNGVVPPQPPPSSWASRPDSDVAIWTMKMPAGGQWTLPAAKAGSNRMLYFFEGKDLQIGTRNVSVKQVISLKSDVAVLLRAGALDCQMLMLQGRPIKEPVVQHGPFVMNTRLEIQQTMVDYQRTQFGGWPWPRHDPVHGSEPQRFAKRPDGIVEKPA